MLTNLQDRRNRLTNRSEKCRRMHRLTAGLIAALARSVACVNQNFARLSSA
jgi:hypothetical protein